MRRLRVGFDASGLASGKPPTGLERYSFALIRQLAALRGDEGLELFLYFPNPPPQRTPELSAPPPGKALHWRIAPAVRGWYRAGMGLRMGLDRLDVMHFPAPRLARFCPAPAVVTIHDLAAMSLDAALTVKERQYLADARDAGRRASALIAVSASASAEIARYFGRECDIIHEGVDLEQFQPASADAIAALRREHGLPPRYILCVGTLQTRKNHLRLMDAFEAIQDHIPHTLLIVGRDGSGAQAIHQRLAERPNSRIRLLGFLPEAQLPALYSGADALALPSLWEGFGLPILEAMACETPVLTSNVSSLIEVAGDAALTVDPTNTGGMADGLYRLATDEALRAALRQRGRARARQFSWAENAQRTVAVYRRAAASGRRLWRIV